MEEFNVNVTRITHILEILSTMNWCIKENRLMSFLILFYSSIDSMAYLNKDPSKENVINTDYISWCDTFLCKYINRETKGIDLYSARCGILHTLTPTSKLVKENKAINIGYTIKSPLADAINTKTKDNMILLEANNLLDAFKKATNDFFNAINNDHDLYIKVSSNLENGFISLNL